MQREEILERNGLNNLIDVIFSSGNPQVSEDYSDYGEEIIYFRSADEIKNYIENSIDSGKSFENFAIYYPEAKGYVEAQKIDLDPKKCKGHTFRYCIRGWGIIQLQLDFGKKANVKCRIAVNTEKRANNWAETYPDLKPPSLWDWKLVEKNARRLINELKKHAQQII